MWVNFIDEWRHLLFRVNSEQLIFWETFHGDFIYSQRFRHVSAKRKLPKTHFCFFRCLMWVWTEASRLIKQHTTSYDFNTISTLLKTPNFCSRLRRFRIGLSGRRRQETQFKKWSNSNRNQWMRNRLKWSWIFNFLDSNSKQRICKWESLRTTYPCLQIYT